MEMLAEGVSSIFGYILGTGGILYAVIMHYVERKKYKAEVEEAQANADLKSDEFWKNRYQVLESEIKNKDAWWKERYDNLYEELQNERKLSNEIVSNFRSELNDIREDYERQREIDKKKYRELHQRYTKFQEESARQNAANMRRINQLENLVSEYEKKMKIKKPKTNEQDL